MPEDIKEKNVRKKSPEPKKKKMNILLKKILRTKKDASSAVNILSPIHPLNGVKNLQ